MKTKMKNNNYNLLDFIKISESAYKVIVKSNSKLVGFFSLEVDGCFYFSAEEDRGVWSDYALLEIGEKLKELNKPWVDHVEWVDRVEKHTETLPQEVDIDKDIEYFFELYKRKPSSTRAYKNLIKAMEVHHIYQLTKNNEEKEA